MDTGPDKNGNFKGEVVKQERNGTIRIPSSEYDRVFADIGSTLKRNLSNLQTAFQSIFNGTVGFVCPGKGILDLSELCIGNDGEIVAQITYQP